MERRTPASDTARMGFVSKAALELMTWDWQDREKLVQALIRKVPPGKALRKYEALTANREARVKAELTEDEKIYSGARNLVTSSLGTLEATGRVEFDEDRQRVRLKERRASVLQAREAGDPCPACHRPFVTAPTSQMLAEGPKSNVIKFPVRRAMTERREAR